VLISQVVLAPAEIARRLGVSLRTVRYDLEAIELAFYAPINDLP
jgi:transcriptional antiterminator